MKMSEFMEAFNELTYGSEHPTHVYVGHDLYDAIDELVAAEWKGRVRNEDGSLPFNGARVFPSGGNVPSMAAHFHNEKRPHDPRYNAYRDWTPPMINVPWKWLA